MSAITGPHVPQDFGSLTIGGIDLTCKFPNATWSTQKTEVDVSSVCQEGELNQTVGIQGMFSGEFFGGSSTGFVTNYLDFSGINVGGGLVQPQLYSMDFSGTYVKADLPAYTAGLAQGILRRNFSGKLEMLLDDTDVAGALVVAAESMTFTDAETYLQFTLNAQSVKLPIKLGNVSHPVTVGDYQKVTVDFASQAPARGVAFPTLPASLPTTPGLLDWALLSPRTNRAFNYNSKVPHGIHRTGYLTFGDFSFRYAQREVTRFNYQFLTFGDFATTVST